MNEQMSDKTNELHLFNNGLNFSHEYKNILESAKNKRLLVNLYIMPALLDIIIHQIFFRARDWSRRITWPNMPQLKLGNIREYAPGDIPQFSNFAIYVRAFSFYLEKIIHLSRAEHFK